jgi:hypothetical protein
MFENRIPQVPGRRLLAEQCCRHRHEGSRHCLGHRSADEISPAHCEFGTSAIHHDRSAGMGRVVGRSVARLLAKIAGLMLPRMEDED